MPDLSFKEKSILGTLIGITLVSFWYFETVLGMLQAGATDLVALGKLAVGLVIFFILVEIVFHTLLAARWPRDAAAGEDERDQLIELKGERVGGLLLGLGVVSTIGHIALNALFETAAPSHFLSVNLLLLSLTIAEIGKYVSQLIYYRRGT